MTIVAGTNITITTDAGADSVTINSSGGGGAPEGTAVLSTGEGGGTKFLREDGDGTCSWQDAGGGGDRSLSAYTNLDSDSEVLLVNHSYLAATDGAIYAYADQGTTNLMKLWIGTTPNPVSTGTLIQQHEMGDAGPRFRSMNALVAEGEYFEIARGGVVTMYWKSFGALGHPVDQEA